MDGWMERDNKRLVPGLPRSAGLTSPVVNDMSNAAFILGHCNFMYQQYWDYPLILIVRGCLNAWMAGWLDGWLDGRTAGHRGNTEGNVSHATMPVNPVWAL